MLNLILPHEIERRIINALQQAEKREIGGIILAKHVGHNEFAVMDITIQGIGTFASFVRKIEGILSPIQRFFDHFNHDYKRFNYIGEWHSHPSFQPEPSSVDDETMRKIAADPKVGANFVVLLVVKLNMMGQLLATAHTYLPNGHKQPSTITLVDSI